MGRQIKKTKKAIYDAFSELLLQKSYSKITMQEIADTADVGRSTVYSHFETKEALLASMCSDIFEELLSHEHILSDTHEDVLIALLTHIKSNKKIIMGIFLSDGMDVFVEFCKKKFAGVIDSSFVAEYDEIKAGIPKDCLINHLVGSFMEMVRWWAQNKMKQTPEEIAEYYLKLTMPVIESLFVM